MYECYIVYQIAWVVCMQNVEAMLNFVEAMLSLVEVMLRNVEAMLWDRLDNYV